MKNGFINAAFKLRLDCCVCDCGCCCCCLIDFGLVKFLDEDSVRFDDDIEDVGDVVDEDDADEFDDEVTNNELFLLFKETGETELVF